MNPLPHMKKIFFLLIRQERQQIALIEKEKMVAQIAKPYVKGCPNDSWAKTFCSKLDRTIEVCFKNDGLPPYLKKLNISQMTIDDQSQENSTLEHFKANFQPNKEQGLEW